ncbi:EpsG family protein [Chryseobacterium ginsenosidimutans]|uniref:EpsG family protein n=1 Tax=Chryseobacterium ginsenosidimutans TaxID=687846 RepID=UPI002168BA51|nr:EpsG family protein [Chryseobacterium ginsenosidimutans]
MIYLIVFIYLFILSISFDFLKAKGPKNFFYYLSMIILILIAGLRWKVGGDSLVYQDRFEKLIYPIYQLGNTNFLKVGWEPGYILVNSLCKTIVPEFWFFQLVQATFVNIFVFQFFKRYTQFYFTAVLFYSVLYYFYFNMEILREIIPICIFARFMFPALKEENHKKYYIVNIIMIFFHTSAVVLLLLPFLSKFKLDKKGLIILGVAVLITTALFSLFPNIAGVFAFTDSLSSKFVKYSRYSLSINGMIYNFIIFALFPYYLIKLNEKYYDKLDFEKLIFPYFFIISIYISYSGFGRFINYFGLFMLVFFVNTLYLVMHVSVFKKVRLILILLLSFCPLYYKYQYYSTSYDHIIREANKFNMYYPYSSIFNKEDYYKYRAIIHSRGMSDSYNNSNKGKN